MRIGVTSQNFRTVTAHAGMTRKFLVFEASPDGSFREVGRIRLPKEQAMHHVAGSEAHPLDGLDTIIAGSAGAGFVRKLAARGVRVVTTAEVNPEQAVRDLLHGRIKPAATRECTLHDHQELAH